MPCACGASDHQKITSKKCPLAKPRWAAIPPPANIPLTESHRSVKAGLNSILRTRSKKGKRLLSTILRTVDTVTRNSFEASRLLQVHLQRLIEEDLPLPPLDNLTWLVKVFDIFHKDNTTDPELNASFSLYKAHRGACHPLPGLADTVPQIKKFVVRDYSANIQTHLKRLFWVVTKRHLTLLYCSRGIPRLRAQSIASFVQKSALGLISDDDNDEEVAFDEVVSGDDAEEGDEHEAESNVDDGMVTSTDELAERVALLVDTYEAGWQSRLVYLYHTNMAVMNRGGRITSLVPLYTPEAKYITIDTDALWGLLGRKDGTGLDSVAFGQDQLCRWSSIVKLPNRLLDTESRKRFSCMIRTDGLACTVSVSHWVPKRPKLKETETKAARMEYAKERKAVETRRLIGLTEKDCVFIGIDPGRAAPFTVVKEANGYETTTSLSSGRYYHDCKYKYRLQRMKLWMRRLHVDTWWQQQPSSRYGRLHDTLENIRYLFSGPIEHIFGLRLSRKCKKLRWKVHIHQQKTLDRFADEILRDLPPDKHTVIAFGDGKFNRSSKGYVPSPHQKKLVDLLRRAKQRASWRRYNVTVLDIWEFNTSQVCSKCHCHRGVKDCAWTSKPHFVRRCLNPSCRTIWNRVSRPV
jgi:hypothetical protein